ncbi:MAG: hypothetical protein CMJ85_00735 [Planctomycetes bacterium]|jgi:hypothetical protein|nr:hypothetical protein [Planctomycetota bacterium]MDP6425082.1 M12 family metallopeptidase [Planctomycetota bacterium]
MRPLSLLVLALLPVTVPAQGARCVDGCIHIDPGPATWAGRPWPNGIVHFVIDPAVNPQNHARSLHSMRSWEKVSGLRFIPRTTEAAYIHIRNSGNNSSSIGRTGGQQFINIANWERKYTIMHEICHAVGFWHEHMRADRDTYIQVHSANINCASQYRILTNVELFDVPYDFESIMHYHRFQCSSNAQPTMTVRPPWDKKYTPLLGQRIYLSALDVRRMNVLYPRPQVGQLFEHGRASIGDQLGAAVVGLHDVDGDKVPDFAGGAPGDDGGGKDAGRVTVWSGANGAALRCFTGAAAGNGLGVALASAGDVNGDSIDDLLVGGNGLVEVVSGKWLRDASGPRVLRTLRDAASGPSFGHAAAGGVDLDADKVPDVVVGAPLAVGNFPSAGRVIAYSGKTGAELWRRTGVSLFELGTGVAIIGDGNTDGVPDVAAGEPGRALAADGSVYLLSGRDGTVLRRRRGAAIGDSLGTSIANAGDANNDGVDDVIAGAPQTAGRGRARLLSGKDLTELLLLEGESLGDRFGTSVGGIADSDGDGRPDLVVGAPRANVATGHRGIAYVFSSRDGYTLARFTGIADKGEFGGTVAGCGDGNGDGTPDFAVGAAGAASDAGAVHLISGRPALAPSLVLDRTRSWSTVQMKIEAGAVHAGGFAVLLGSFTGTRPGVLAGKVRLPVQFDAYTSLLLAAPGALLNPAIPRLDSLGRATATWSMPLTVAQAVRPLTLYHSFAVLGAGLQFATNAAPLTIAR